jgi:hypothetical protein
MHSSLEQRTHVSYPYKGNLMGLLSPAIISTRIIQLRNNTLRRDCLSPLSWRGNGLESSGRISHRVVRRKPTDVSKQHIISIFNHQQSCACHLFSPGFLLSLFFGPEDGGDMFLPKHQLTFNWLHDVSQSVVLFTCTAYFNNNSILI